MCVPLRMRLKFFAPFATHLKYPAPLDQKMKVPKYHKIHEKNCFWNIKKNDQVLSPPPIEGSHPLWPILIRWISAFTCFSSQLTEWKSARFFSIKNIKCQALYFNSQSLYTYYYAFTSGTLIVYIEYDIYFISKWSWLPTPETLVVWTHSRH